MSWNSELLLRDLIWVCRQNFPSSRKVNFLSGPCTQDVRLLFFSFSRKTLKRAQLRSDCWTETARLRIGFDTSGARGLNRTDIYQYWIPQLGKIYVLNGSVKVFALCQIKVHKDKWDNYSGNVLWMLFWVVVILFTIIEKNKFMILYSC